VGEPIYVHPWLLSRWRRAMGIYQPPYRIQIPAALHRAVLGLPALTIAHEPAR
jgi:hypothetical protein